MSNSIFDLLGIDLDATLEKLVNLKDELANVYNNKVDEIKENMKKYDLNTDEGYEEFIKEAANVRKELLNSDSIFAPKLIEILDSSVEKAMKKHAENKKETVKVTGNNSHAEGVNSKANGKVTVNDIVKDEVNRNIKENHGKLNVNIKPVEDNGKAGWPSEKLSFKQKRNVWKLVDEYVETMIEPYVDSSITEDQLNDMSSGLFEFAAWILTKEEE